MVSLQRMWDASDKETQLPSLKKIEKLMTAEQIAEMKTLAKWISEQRDIWSARAFMDTEDRFEQMVMFSVRRLFYARAQENEKDTDEQLTAVIQRFAAIAWLRATAAKSKPATKKKKPRKK